ncbi:ubiquitin carboxyl-terminal hydrolase 35 [Pectinophora gossypiella]|uniref:ubiquitin carboxyl-terminal hydrolase 35 n=1 Tax=Pectinophora gossypiella TaxID=13191 RepID=UPI00214E6A6E|nr:ubiquitin carboxyl-terminal hydrolase 35 [Pectinophora gossypiella]
MAVKKHKLVQDNHNQLDLAALAQYIQLMNTQTNYLPPPNQLVKNCTDIVKCLARATGTEEELWTLLPSVEVFLLRVVNTVHSSVRHEIVTAVLDKFYTLISDPQSDACPATSIVLTVLEGWDSEATLSAARWLVQQSENGPAGAGHRASLSCLYRWLYEWNGTALLGDWVMAYIKALEENEGYDILIEVSVDNLSNLFVSLADGGMRSAIADVIFHVLASMRESTEALGVIQANVADVLTKLARDSGQFSRQILQNIVDIVTAMVDYHTYIYKGEALDGFRAKHAELIDCLERHMASRGCRFLQMPPWRGRCLVVPTANPSPPVRKVGLLNLGNTCYMNSVMQALLVTRQFSNHVMMQMTDVPYWSKMGLLFAKMMHSISTKLNPDEFFSVVKPPFFTKDNQHDSSEFLGYLFELLQSYEHVSDVNFDYSRPALLNGAHRMRHAAIAHVSHSSSDHDAETNRRSVSPRPGSSAAGSSSYKRAAQEHDMMVPLKKRRHLFEGSFLRRDSFIDNMFSGVLLTRVECTTCRSSSLSRDVFRDLQLAFPERPEDVQHNVQSLLEYYCSKESLSGDNKYECRDCGCLRDAERSVLIETTPKYLILVLKNFKFEPKLQVQTKLMHSMFHNTIVNLPTVRSQHNHAVYALYAAVIHAGTTLDSGHYYTLAMDSKDWYMFNDDVVSEAEEKELNELKRSCTPYILFYRRTDMEEAPAPSLEELPPHLQEAVLAHNKHYVETVRKKRLTRP